MEISLGLMDIAIDCSAMLLCCLKIDSYDFANGSLWTQDGVVLTDPLIRFKGDQDVLLTVTSGAGILLH